MSGNTRDTVKIPKTKQQDYLQKLADRVWELWREELRLEQERQGKFKGR